MKNLLRNITLVVVSFLAFSCSEEPEVTKLKPTSIYKLIKADNSSPTTKFSLFIEALELAGKAEMLDAPGTYTVLVPNDDAFNTFLAGKTITEYEAAHPGDIAKIINNHIIVNTRIISLDIVEGETFTNAAGGTLTANYQNNPYYPEVDQELGLVQEYNIYIDVARLMARDAEASNGIIHIVDNIIAPVTGS